MKKLLSLVLVSVLFISSVQFCICAENVPAYCMFSDIENGRFTVTVYGNSVKKLTNAVINIKYDVDVFSMEDYIESDFDEESWEYGELADKSGCAAAFVSPSGVTKSSLSVLCRFTFSVENGYSDNTSVKVILKEFITNDGKENDIFSDETVAQRKIILSDSKRFSYTESDSETVVINGYNFDEDFVIIPSVIDKKTVSGISGGAFGGCDDNVFIFANGTQKSYSPDSYKYILFSEDCAVDFDLKIVRTKTNLCRLSENTVKTNAENVIVPSYSYNDGNTVFFGTGSTFTFKSGKSEMTFYLSIKGDIDGDSVYDVCDLCELERASSGNKSLSDVQFFTADVNSDGKINERDEILFYKFEGEKITEGDVDGDGVFDVVDITYFEKALNGIVTLTENEFVVADVNGDGEYNSQDYSLLVDLL